VEKMTETTAKKEAPWNFKALLKQLVPFLGLILVVILFEILSDGKLLSSRNMTLLLNQAFTLSLGAIGCAFVIAQGNLDFSLGGIVGISAALAAGAAGMSPVLSVIVAVAVGILIGIFNGSIHAFFGIPAFVVTLAVQFILRGLVVVATKAGTLPIPFSMYSIDNTGLKLSVLIIMFVAGYIVFEYTKVGKQSKALGSGIAAAAQSGVNVRKMKIVSFAIVGALSGLCGFFSLIRAGAASTATGQFFETDVMTALVLGGMPLSGGSSCRIKSAIIGSLILAVLTNGMVLWGINEHMQQLIKGCIFILAVWISLDKQAKEFVK
jgi:ribose transport system permease protein